MSFDVDRICIIGTGLIGGSLALALRANGFEGEIIGAGRTEKTLQDARSLGIIDEYETDMAVAVKGVGMVFISVPLGAIRPVLQNIASAVDADTIITDAGSAKGSVIDDARAVLADVSRFVPGHPIAGTEKSGAHAAFKELYTDRRVILTPLDENAGDAVAAVTEMWALAGANVTTMTAEHHDLVLAGTSHLPHMLAYGLVDCLNNMEDVEEIFQYAAGGFRDFTRIASSDPTMWRDICMHNTRPIIDLMNRYRASLDEIQNAMEAGDGEKIKTIFERAKAARDKFNG